MATHPVMGLGLFFFAHDEWKKLYVANCANHSMIGYANVPVGFLFSTMGIVCEVIRYKIFPIIFECIFSKTFLLVHPQNGHFIKILII